MGYLVLIVLMMILWIFVYSLPPRRSHRLHLFERKQPLVIAHQGGKGLAPSSTMPAFQRARSLGVDVLEFDVHMTSDGHLVAIHDPTVDRTTDGSGKVNDMTLAEIKRLDAGYSFQDEHGSYPYRGKGVTIPTVEEIFSATSDPDMLYIIEIKHTNDPALYEEIATKLWGIIEKFRLEERVIIASFDQNIIDTVLKISGRQALVSAGKREATKFVLTHKLFLNGLYRPGVDALHFPLKSSGFNLVDKKLIRGAQRRGMQIHYWTVNDPETMGKLLELGADGIMTDYPDRLMKLINK